MDLNYLSNSAMRLMIKPDGEPCPRTISSVKFSKPFFIAVIDRYKKRAKLMDWVKIFNRSLIFILPY